MGDGYRPSVNCCLMWYSSEESIVSKLRGEERCEVREVDGTKRRIMEDARDPSLLSRGLSCFRALDLSATLPATYVLLDC